MKGCLNVFFVGGRCGSFVGIDVSECVSFLWRRNIILCCMFTCAPPEQATHKLSSVSIVMPSGNRFFSPASLKSNSIRRLADEREREREREREN